MSKKNWGLWMPFVLTAIALAVVAGVAPRASTGWGIALGLAIALAQSMISTGALAWSWNKKNFYWVWGGGMLFRMAVFAATAFFTYRYTHLSFVATMTSMVFSTTVFLVFESTIFFSKPT